MELLISSKKNKEVYRQCLFILEEYSEAFIIAEYQEVVNKLAILSNRVQNDEVKAIESDLRKKQTLIGKLFSNGTTRFIRAAKPRASKEKGISHPKQGEIKWAN